MTVTSLSILARGRRCGRCSRSLLRVYRLASLYDSIRRRRQLELDRGAQQFERAPLGRSRQPRVLNLLRERSCASLAAIAEMDRLGGFLFHHAEASPPRSSRGLLSGGGPGRADVVWCYASAASKPTNEPHFDPQPLHQLTLKGDLID
jgi:hypothetical protein